MTSDRAVLDLAAPWRLLRNHRDLRLLLAAGLVSMTGDWLLGVGLTYSVYALTGSTLASAVTLLAGFVPQVLAGLVAGVFVDRWDRRRTMIGANLLLALGLLPLLAVHDADHIWLVYVVLVVESLVEVFVAPAEQALLPRLVGHPDDLLTANALNGQVQNLARLVGSALGGVAAAAGGIPAVALLDALTFLLATGLLLRIRVPGHLEGPEWPDVLEESAPPAEQVVRGRLAALRAEWTEGLTVAWRTPVVRVLLWFSLITATGEGIMGTLFAPYVRAVLHGGPQTLGVITSAQAVGGIVGGLAAATIGHRWRPVVLLGAGSVVFGLVDLAIFLYPLLVVTPWPAVVGMVVVGLPGAVVSAGMMTLFQQHTGDAERGRVFGLVLLARSVAMVVGTTAAGLLGDVVGILPVLAFQGVGYVVAGLLVLVVLPRVPAASPRVEV